MNLKDYRENNKMLSEEYFGWIGNGIFLSAQLLQVFHTFVVKKKSMTFHLVSKYFQLLEIACILHLGF